MIQYLAELPPEIYDGILAHVPRSERQQATLSLTRAIPRSPVPLHYLFECIHLKSAENVVQLYHRLRGRVEEPCWIKEFSLETWNADADVVVNLVALLPQLFTIMLFVGPNFAPEHMEEMLQKPSKALSHVSLRFRPYVQKATYYQFLKGTYFDTTLLALSRWPRANLATLSIVQDPLDPEFTRAHHFAQPLVFFRLDGIKTLACSSYLRSLTNLRLRIPSRQVVPLLCGSPYSIPGLRILDLSTCHIRLTDLEALVAQYSHLIHLIIDGCNVTWGESEWARVGMTCALATVKKAREREKKLKAWLELHIVHTTAEPQFVIPEEIFAARRTRPGRRGLATATISLRDPQVSMTTSVMETNTVVPRIRVVPSLPVLCSLSKTTSTLHEEKHDAIRVQFKRGWDEGLAQLTAIRRRLYQSWRNGVRVMRIIGEPVMEEGFDDLEDVDGEGAFHGPDGSDNIRPAPVLCLAGGAASSVQHVDGCGHTAVSSVWSDGI